MKLQAMQILRDKVVSLTGMIAGAKYRGDFERIKSAIDKKLKSQGHYPL